MASVAILREGQAVAEYTWRAAGRHTTQLLPIVDRLCHDVALPMDEWSAIAVATGPGSFNGIRAAMATALGLAVSRSVPLVGIGTLDILAYQAYLGQWGCHFDEGTTLYAIMPAGRGEVYYATYVPQQATATEGPATWATMTRREGPAVATAEQLQHMASAHHDTPVLICGALTSDLSAMLREQDGGNVAIAPPASGVRRATYLALLAAQYLESGGPDQLLTIAPLYLRRVTVTQSRRPLSIATPEST